MNLPLVCTSQEECLVPVFSILLLSVFLFFFTLLFLTPWSFLQAVAALPWNFLAGSARNLHFPLAERQWLSHISSIHFLFARWNRVGLGLLLGGCCVFAGKTVVSQKSFAAPCHCPKSIDRLCWVLHPCLHFLTLS